MRAPEEPVDQGLTQFYHRLLTVLLDPAVRDGRWQLLECRPAWDGNWTWDCFVVYAWTGKDGEKRLIAVNYSAHQSQCSVALPWPDLEGRSWQPQDQLSVVHFERNGNEFAARGLYLDMPAWAYHVFAMH